MRPLAALAVLGCLAAIPAAARAQGKVLQVAGPETGEEPAPKLAGDNEGTSGPAEVAGDADGKSDPGRDPRLLLTTSFIGVGLSHARPLGVDDGATAFEGRFDSDYTVRAQLLSARVRMELAIGGGSRLTGSGSFALLGGVAGSLSPGKYVFGRIGAEAFYRQRPWGYASVVEAPKVEAGLGIAPVALSGDTIFKKLAIDLTVSGGLVAGAWAADEDPTLEPYKRSVEPSFGGSASFTLPGGSIRTEYLRVQSDVPLSSLRVRPCFAALFFATCIDAELVQTAFARTTGGEFVNRSVFSIGLLFGVGIAWFEPQVPKELPPNPPPPRSP
jgi:hypothetical protein